MTADTVVLQFSTAAPSSFRPFSKGWKNRYSKWIRKLGHSPFSHIDFLLQDGTLLGASDSPDAPHVYGNPRGVAVRIADYQHFGCRRRMVIKTDKADAVLAFAFSQVGKPFDTAAVSAKEFLSDRFPGARDFRSDDAWFCAELAIVAFEKGGYWGGPLPWPKNRISPSDVYFAFMMDSNFVNRDEFFAPIPTLKMGVYET